MKCPRKRTLLMVLLLLTGGAIINVAVAWGCSFNAPSLAVRGFSQPAIQEATAVWNRYALPGTPPAPPGMVFVDRVRGTNPQGGSLRAGLVYTGSGAQASNRFGIEQLVVTRCERVAMGAQTKPNPMYERWVICEFRVGIPFRCLVAGTFQTESAGAFEITGGIVETVGSIPVGSLNSMPAPIHSFLPYFVLPSGFIFNTMFYAAILWLPFAGFRLVRRRIRVRRGQCPGCAYPVGSSTVCTECGKAVKIRQLAMGNWQ